MKVTELIRQFEGQFNNNALRHILLNYADSETGLRHPEGPVGVMCRDQGVLDAYAGRSRLLLGVDGTTLMLAKNLGLSGDWVSLRSYSRNTLVLNGRVFSKRVFNQEEALFLKSGVDIGKYSVNDIAGQPVPLSRLLNQSKIMETPEMSGLTTRQSDNLNIFKNYTGLLAGGTKEPIIGTTKEPII